MVRDTEVVGKRAVDPRSAALRSYSIVIKKWLVRALYAEGFDKRLHSFPF